jgi:hypothetical protein
MATDLTDAVVSYLSNFTVGLVYRETGAKNHEVLGSGVLATIEGRRGILTCGHVAEKFEKKHEVGLISFSAGKQHKFALRFDLNLIMASSHSFEESEEVLDLAFTLFPPELAISIEAAKGVFLNIANNELKMGAFASSRGKFVDAILGMVGEFSDEPCVEGREITSNLHGSLYTGRICPVGNGLLVFEPRDTPEKLPKSFGGMSGGGVWRIYYDQEGSDTVLADYMLCGIASWERREEKKITCQGWDRIDQALIPEVRKTLPQ